MCAQQAGLETPRDLRMEEKEEDVKMKSHRRKRKKKMGVVVGYGEEE